MNTTKETLLIFWSHAKRYPGYLIGIAIIRPLSVITFRIIPPLIAARVIDRLGRGDYIPGEYWPSFSTEIFLFAASVVLGGVILLRIDLFLIWRLEVLVVRDLLRSMFKKYMELDTSFHADSFGGSLVSRANKLTSSYIRFADTLAFMFVPFIIIMISIAVIMLPLSPTFVIGVYILTTVFILITTLLGQKVQRLETIEAKGETANTGFLADAVTNVMAIKSFSALNSEAKRFEKVTESTRLKGVNVINSVLLRDFFASLVTSSVQVAAIIIAVIAIVEKNGDLATVFLMLSYSALLAQSLWEFQSSVLRNFNRSMGDAHEATTTLNTKPKVKDIRQPKPFRSIRGSIEFKNVIFSHLNQDDDSALFNRLSLRIRPGEKIGLVGHSGGGKSTLTKLIMRMMDIDSGEILIDGQNIAQVRQSDLRRYLSYVPQEPIMFHRSLYENIAYGRTDATKEEVVAAAKMAHAHNFISSLQDGYDTLVGERGVKLSGGQRQRVAIARAMLKNALILLLDEATSALDSESEKLIQDALWKLIKNKAAIVIAHRLSTIQQMDRILVLENGEIVEEGSHKELLKNDGIYAELWKHQSGGFIEE